MPVVRVHRDIAVKLIAGDAWRSLGSGQRSRDTLAQKVENAAAAISAPLDLKSATRGIARFNRGTVLKVRLLPHLLEGAGARSS